MEKDKRTAFSYLECVCSWLQLERVPQRIYPLCETLHSGVKVVNHLLLCPVFPTLKCFNNCSYFSIIVQSCPFAPPRVPLQVCIVTLLRCISLSSGKIILPSSNPASLISDRVEMNKGSKGPFLSLFSHCQVIFTLGPCGSAQCHTHQLHMTGFFIPGILSNATITAVPNMSEDHTCKYHPA